MGIIKRKCMCRRQSTFCRSFRLRADRSLFLRLSINYVITIKANVLMEGGISMRENKTVPDDFMDLIKTFNIGSYFDPLNKIQERLEFENSSQAEVEALLINAIVNFYDNDKNRFKTDIVLMALGLLKGFDNRPRTNDIEFSVGKSLYAKRTKKFHERTDYNLTGNGLSAIEKSVKRELEKLASEIYAKKKDNEYLKESAKKYPSPRKDYIPEECLPDMFYYQWVENSSAQAPALSAGYYIKKIRTSTHHDDVAMDLYKALCGDGEPPSTKWVAAWIYKCINEKFKKTMDKDILLASFALLKDSKLEGENGLKCRMGQYLEYSLYIDTHPSESRNSSLGKLLASPKELNQLKEKLEKKESGLVEELIIYIETGISDYEEHIKNLQSYDNSTNENSSYNPDSTDLLFSKENIELSQKIHKAKKWLQSLSAAALFCMIIGICSLWLCEVSNEEKIRDEFSRSMAWGKGDIEQNEPVKERPNRDGDKPFSNKPYYAGESETINEHITEAL